MSGFVSTRSQTESQRTSLPSRASARTRSKSVYRIVGMLADRDCTRYATDIVRECAEAWERLITGKTNPGDISL